MVTFVKLNDEDDAATVVVGDMMHIIIKHNDIGISIDYYDFVDDQPFKSDQIWFDDLKEKS